MLNVVLFQTIQFDIKKTCAFQSIQFDIIMQFRSIWPINRTQSGTTIWGQSGPEGNGIKGVLRIP